MSCEHKTSCCLECSECRECAQEAPALRAELARLRAALEKIRDGEGCDTPSFADCCDQECMAIARTALSGSAGDP